MNASKKGAGKGKEEEEKGGRRRRRRGALLTFFIRVCALGQEEFDELLAIFDARCDHEWRPAHVVLYRRWENGNVFSLRQAKGRTRQRPLSYLYVEIKALLLGQELDNVQLVGAGGPVDGQTTVVVFSCA